MFVELAPEQERDRLLLVVIDLIGRIAGVDMIFDRAVGVRQHAAIGGHPRIAAARRRMLIGCDERDVRLVVGRERDHRADVIALALGALGEAVGFLPAADKTHAPFAVGIERLVDVADETQAVIIAELRLETAEGFGFGFLARQVDEAARGAVAIEDRGRPLHDVDLLDAVEIGLRGRIGARDQPHAVEEKAGRKAAQIHLVVTRHRAAALVRRDAGDIADRLVERDRIAALQLFAVDHRDRLRRFDQRGSRLGRRRDAGFAEAGYDDRLARPAALGRVFGGPGGLRAHKHRRGKRGARQIRPHCGARIRLHVNPLLLLLQIRSCS